MFKKEYEVPIGIEAGNKPEKNEKQGLDKKQEKFLNLLVKKYLDDSGNIRSFKLTADFPLGIKPLVDEELEKAWEDLGYNHPLNEDFEPEFLVNEGEIIKEILARISGNYSQEEKMVLIKIINDMSKGVVMEGTSEQTVKRNLDCLKSLYEDKDLSFLLKMYIKNKMNDSLAVIEALDEYFYDEIIEEYGTMFDFKNKISDFNISSFDDVKYNFSSGMVGCINESIHKDHYETNLSPLKKEDLEEEDYNYGATDDNFYYSGEYITAKISPGNIGIYTREGDLVGWQNEKMINDSKEETSPVDLECPEDLYKEFSTSDSKEGLLLFKTMLSLSYRKALEEKIGIDIAELDVKNQVYFLNFIKNNTEKEVDEVVKFLNSGKDEKSRIDRIKSFLSLEADQNNGERILEIGDKLDSEKANMIFSKVAEFNDVLVRADENLSKYFYKENEKRDFNQFREKLLKKMHQIIFDFSDNLEAGKKKSDKDVSVLLDDLSKANSDIEILSAFLGSLDESERFEQLEKVKDLAIEKTNKLSDEEINKIATLAEASWSENVQERQVNEKFVENLLKSLRSGLENLTEADEMNILKYKEEIVGVIKFKRKENGALEAESVNVNPEVKGLNIGKFIFEIIKQKAEKDDIYLYGCVKTKVVSHYVNELGAVGYGFNDDDLDADEPSLRMKIAKTNHEKTENSNSFDIERKFRINDPNELLKFREFLKENLFATDNDGELVEDQNSNEKYSVVKFDWEGDDKKTAHVFLKKNE